MRARYYSPDMRRFVNADIIAGEISETITLNRYAYANGNPVSNVDPLGLFILVEPQLVEPQIVSFLKLTEYFGNSVLYVDSMLSKDTNASYAYSDSNYEYNIKHDKVDDLIYNQTGIALKYGNTYSTGCGPISVYNAMILLGFENVSLANIIRAFETSNAVSFQKLANGSLGSNPYAFPRIFEKYNIKYSSISDLKDLNEPGVYIIGYWNGLGILEGSHYVTIQISENGKKTVYNGKWEDVEKGGFMVGYEVDAGEKIEVGSKVERK